jgi:hypothetical protein
VSGLVHTDLATAWQAEPSQPAPAFLRDVGRELDALGAKLVGSGLDVVAYEIELVRWRPFGRVYRRFRRRQSEDEPAAACIDMREPEHVGEERPVRFGVAAEEDDVATIDHASEPKNVGGRVKMQVTHHFDADVETVFALMSDPDFCMRKYADAGATDIQVDADQRDFGPKLVSRRKLTVDLPGFAKKVMQPTNTVVQTDEWSAADDAGKRTCRYSVEVQGLPSRIDGTVTLSPDGGGTKQDVQAEVKVSIPLLGGKLEKFAVENGVKALEHEAVFTAKELGDR